MWNPIEHSDQENLQWAWLRAVEWGAWPIFISQPIAPVALLYFPWWSVLIVLIVVNATWTLFISYRMVVPVLAFWGALFVRMKWITCPIASYFLWQNDMKGTAFLALFWPLVTLVIPRWPTQIGVIQKMFMRCMGYEPSNDAKRERQETDAIDDYFAQIEEERRLTEDLNYFAEEYLSTQPKSRQVTVPDEIKLSSMRHNPPQEPGSESQQPPSILDQMQQIHRQISPSQQQTRDNVKHYMENREEMDKDPRFHLQPSLPNPLSVPQNTSLQGVSSDDEKAERNRRHEAAVARIAAEDPMVEGKDFTLIRPTSENVPMRVLSEEFQKTARKVN